MNSDQTQLATGQPAGTRTHFEMADWLFAFILVASTFLAYQPAWRGQPIWDDGEHMTSAEFASLNGLGRIWFEPGATRHYYPLLDTAFWIQQKLWGGSTLGYHLVNIACHAAGALLVLVILRRSQVKGAWLAAAIFALHPVHVESVAWISELKNTMSGIFYLGAVLVYLRFDETRKPSWFAIAAGLFLCALLSKSTTVVWPIGMLVILWWKHGVLSWKRDALPLIPLMALAVLDGWVAVRVEHGVLGAPSTELKFTLLQRLFIAGRACWFYLGKLLWPVGLCPIYPRWQIDHATGADYVYLIGILVLLTGLWAVRNRNRAPLAAMLFFIGTLSPLLGMVSFSYSRYSFVADHFQYLASLGVITLLAASGARLQDTWRLLSRPASIGLCLVMLAALGGLTWRHSRAYADLETFARATLARNPDCWLAHDHLGIVLASQGKPGEAIEQYHEALRLNPEYALGHYNLGCALAAEGRSEEAIQQYDRAVQLQPDLTRAHYNLGCTLATGGRFAEAIEQYDQVLRLKPDDPDAHNNLGVALASCAKLNAAIGHFEQAVRLRPAFADAHFNLGLALSAQKKFAEAIQHYDQAARLQPDFAEAHRELARLLITRESGALEDAARAVQLAERACRLTGGQQPAYLDTLAAAYAAAHRFPEAIATAKKAFELANTTGQAQLATEIQNRLRLYQAGQLYETSDLAHSPAP
jgi:tetratricopeptide (TPR) repeat protein